MAESTFDRFSVFFTGDTVFLDGAVFPLGQLTTDVLNLDGGLLTEIDRRVDDFILATFISESNLFPQFWTSSGVIHILRKTILGSYCAISRETSSGSSVIFEPGGNYGQNRTAQNHRNCRH